MEIASAKSICELEMEDSALFHQHPLNVLDYSIDELNFQPFTSEGYNPKSSNNNTGSYIEASATDAGAEGPAKQLKTNSWNSCTTEDITPKASPSSSQIISFINSISSPGTSQKVYGLYCDKNPNIKAAGYRGNSSSSFWISVGTHEDQFCSSKYVPEPKRVNSKYRNTTHAKDHVMAERKRREKLNQQYIALSVLVPGLKKTDKASILEDSIIYLKQLQERVKTLEEQVAKKTTESMIVVKKSQIYTDDETPSTGENFDSQSNQHLPEIEARVSYRDVIIRIYCEKNKGCIANILSEIEKLHLVVVSSNVLPFGNSTLYITVVAQMEVELDMTVKDLVKNIQLALRKFCTK